MTFFEFFRSQQALPDPSAPLRNSEVDYGTRRILDIPRTHLESLLKKWQLEPILPAPRRVLEGHRDFEWRSATHAELFSLYISSPLEALTGGGGAESSVGVALRSLTLPTQLDIATLAALEQRPGPEAAAWEMFCVRVFAVDLGSFAAFGHVTDRHRRILDAFYAAFEIDASSPVLPPWLSARVRDRVNEYTEVIKRASGTLASPAASVGLAFERHIALSSGAPSGFGFRIVRDTMREAQARVASWFPIA